MSVPKFFYSAIDFPNFVKSSGALLQPTSLCISPWSKQFQYGGAVACAMYSGLAAQAMHVRTSEELRLAQFNLHFFKPVPQKVLYMAPAPALRLGGKVVHLQVSLMGSRSSGEPGEEIARASGVFMRRKNIEQHGVSSTPNRRTLDLERPEQDLVRPGEAPRIGGSMVKHYGQPGVGFFHAIDCKIPSGGTNGKPLTFWSRLHTPLFENEALDPLHRMLLVGEGTNGLTAFLPLKQFSFVNPTFNCTILRPPRSEWVCLRGRTEVCGETGAGLVVGSIYDETDTGSPCCTVSQSLLVEPWQDVVRKNVVQPGTVTERK